MARDNTSEGFERLTFNLIPIPERGSMRFVLSAPNLPIGMNAVVDFVLPRSAWERLAARIGTRLADRSW